MKFTTKDKSKWSAWFAWHPIRTESGNFLWLQHVERIWDEKRNFTILTSYDPGDYKGGWNYRETTS